MQQISYTTFRNQNDIQWNPLRMLNDTQWKRLRMLNDSFKRLNGMQCHLSIVEVVDMMLI